MCYFQQRKGHGEDSINTDQGPLIGGLLDYFRDATADILAPQTNTLIARNSTFICFPYI